MISLITATYGRTEEVRTLLGSLARQSYKDFEFILVDQNPHFILRGKHSINSPFHSKNVILLL